MISTNAIRDLHLAYPGEYETDIRVPKGAEEIFANSPYITPIASNDPEAERIKLEYPEIHRSGWSGRPFARAHTLFLAEKIGRPIPHTSLRPNIYFSQDELLWPNPVIVNYGYEGDYWIINAGIKNDYTLKYYPYYQEVVDKLQGKIKFVQVGQLQHDHKPLQGVIDMRGKTSLRELFRLSLRAQGAVCAVSLQMVVQMALEKPCVVVAGAREGVRWQLFPPHRFLYVNGALECAKYDGCWKSKKQECVDLVATRDGQIPRCMTLITPDMIVENILMYYKGGRLQGVDTNAESGINVAHT